MKDALPAPRDTGHRAAAKRGATRPPVSQDDATEARALHRHIGSMGPGVRKVISAYADTARRARQTGQTLLITYKVSPDGAAEAVEAPAGDRLDAALARARARGTARAAEILRGKDMLTAREFGALIGASHETVNGRRRRHELLGLEGATRGVRYPRWQVTEAGLPLPGLRELFALLGGEPWAVFRFLRAAPAALGGVTALDAIKAGRLDAVLEAARSQAGGAFA